MRLLFTFIALITFVGAFAQSNAVEPKVYYTMEPGIEEIVKAYPDKHSETSGFRVQIGSESGSGSQAKANNIRNEFRKKYRSLDLEVYIIWEAPNYKVRVGDFRTKIEASLIWKQIQDDFPNSYVVGDKIVVMKQEKNR